MVVKLFAVGVLFSTLTLLLRLVGRVVVLKQVSKKTLLFGEYLIHLSFIFEALTVVLFVYYFVEGV